jgi:putative acetyltransferase
LARALEITPATASEVVDLLARRGLVERRDRPEDRRRTSLSVTPEGLARWEAARARAMSALERLLAQMEPPRRAALEDGLESLLEVIEGRGAKTIGGGENGR